MCSPSRAAIRPTPLPLSSSSRALASSAWSPSLSTRCGGGGTVAHCWARAPPRPPAPSSRMTPTVSRTTASAVRSCRARETVPGSTRAWTADSFVFPSILAGFLTCTHMCYRDARVQQRRFRRRSGLATKSAAAGGSSVFLLVLLSSSAADISTQVAPLGHRDVQDLAANQRVQRLFDNTAPHSTPQAYLGL